MTAHTKTLTDGVEVSDVVSFVAPYLYVTNSVRTSASMLLRLLRRPLRYVTFDLPPHYASLEPGDTVWSSHELLPEPPSGYQTWELIPLLVVEVTDAIWPAKITLKCVDLREVYCTFWSPFKTDIGLTDDLNGIAILDQAGGFFAVRDQLAYGERASGAEYLDYAGREQAYQEIRANTPVVDAFGLLVEGGADTNHLLNSTFSEGSGNTFTSWSTTITGAAQAVEFRQYTLVDASGFRRALQLAPAATGEQAYVTQTAAGFTNTYVALKFYYKNGGSVDDIAFRVQRSDTSEYWQESDDTWHAAPVNNPITPNTGVVSTRLYATNVMDLSSSTADLTVSVGYFSAVFNALQITQLQGVELIELPFDGSDTGEFAKYRSPLPTKGAAVTRAQSSVYAVNDSPVRIVSPTRGFVKLTFMPRWSHSDLGGGFSGSKHIWAAEFDTGEFLRLTYFRLDGSNGTWQFWNGDSVFCELDVTGGDLAVRGEAYTIACRWTSEALDEFGLPGQTLDMWVNGVKATPYIGATTQLAAATGNFYFGEPPALAAVDTDGREQADGQFTNVTIGDHCPPEAELLRL